MNLIASVIRTVERAPIPDGVTLAGIDWLCGRTAKRIAGTALSDETRFARSMADYPIAVHADAANAQHYELPPAFFGLTLGPRRKYSCGYYASQTTTLAEAEIRALKETCDHAGLADGQRILELGCGWGSLTLFMAKAYPNARIVAVSNSQGQRGHIDEQARRLREFPGRGAGIGQRAQTQRDVDPVGQPPAPAGQHLVGLTHPRRHAEIDLQPAAPLPLGLRQQRIRIRAGGFVEGHVAPWTKFGRLVARLARSR